MIRRDELLEYICFVVYVKECSDCEGYNCQACKDAINPSLDEYDKQIRADAIDEAIERLKECRSTIQPYPYVDEAIDTITKSIEDKRDKDEFIIHIMNDFDTIQAPTGETCFGCYLHNEYEAYIAGNIPTDQLFHTIAHEYMHYLQDIENKPFDEKEANDFGFSIFTPTYQEGVKDGYNKAIDDVMEKASEIQEQQIEELQKSNRRNRKMWARYMTTYLGHIQVACKRILKEQLKAGEENDN